MDKVLKFARVESSIRKNLTLLVELEKKYAEIRAWEIANEVPNKRPLLQSRLVLDEIRTTLNKTRAIENYHNKYAADRDRIFMVERIIEEQAIFIQSRGILDASLRHSEAIKAGLAKKKDTPEYIGGYSPTEELENDMRKDFSKDPAVIALLEKMKVNTNTNTNTNTNKEEESEPDTEEDNDIDFNMKGNI